MQNLGLFDVIGPIMHGPSSNHTGGANRIGYLAYRLIGGVAGAYSFRFHPIFMRMFTGHRTHVALMAGCLGIREYEDACNEAEQEMQRRGIPVDYAPITGEAEEPDRNTMRILASFDGIDWEINGISVGGGNILISRINGVETGISGNTHVCLYLLKPGTLNTALLDELRKTEPIRLSSGVCGTAASDGAAELLCLEFLKEPGDALRREIQSLLGDQILLTRLIEPITPFAASTGNAPLFSTYEEFLALCKERPVTDVIYAYETNRSGRSREEILAQALQIVDVIDKSMQCGLQGNNQLLCGFCSGNDGHLADSWGKSGRSITGPVFNDAIAKALAMAEISASAGVVVAAPTSGSAGALPGALFATAKRFGSSREQLAEAFLVSAAIGVVIGEKCSFSGSIGGCQVEIGAGAGMAAAGCAYLAGGDAETLIHASSLALKNMLGLVCDPVAAPVEVPCIKRNAIGAAAALMGAEMALAGIRSVVPPDQVVDALYDTQCRIPTELRGACVGGLAAAPIAKDLQARWAEKLERKRH